LPKKLVNKNTRSKPNIKK